MKFAKIVMTLTILILAATALPGCSDEPVSAPAKQAAPLNFEQQKEKIRKWFFHAPGQLFIIDRVPDGVGPEAAESFTKEVEAAGWEVKKRMEHDGRIILELSRPKEEKEPPSDRKQPAEQIRV